MPAPTLAVEGDGGIPAREGLWGNCPSLANRLAGPGADIIVPVAAVLDGVNVVAQNWL